MTELEVLNSLLVVFQHVEHLLEILVFMSGAIFAVLIVRIITLRSFI